MKTSTAVWRTERSKSCALVASATAVRHGFLGGLGHDRHPTHQQLETDRIPTTSLQSPQAQSELTVQSFGFAPPRKPNDWMADSHTRPANSRLAAYGCYRLVGPARISKRGDNLVARLFRGSRIELLDRDGNATPYASTESLVEDEDLASSGSAASMSLQEDGCTPDGLLGDYERCVAECVLVAAHVELCGSACSMDLVDLSMQPAVHHHNGHTYVSVRSLPQEAVIELAADADLRHPINISPVPSA